jgi:hypothetical protein
MRNHDEPAPLTHEELLQEVADILAAGVLRLSVLRSPTGVSDKSAQNCRKGLEVPGDTVLSVHVG